MSYTTLNKIKIVFRCLVGLVFLFSAYLKVIAINGFEIYVYTVNPFNLNFSFFFARLIIGVEFTIGILLLLGYRYKIIHTISIVLLSIFSIFLITQLVAGSKENCFCFRDAISFTPLESLVKNIALIIILLIIRKLPATQFRYISIVSLLFSVGGLVVPFIISPPDNWVQNRYAQYTEFDAEILTQTLTEPIYEGKHLNEGKKLICYFSMGCEYCKLTAGKITGMSEKMSIDSNIIYLFMGDEKNLNQFWDDSDSKKFTYYILPVEDFFKASGSHLPAIYFVDNGNVVKKAAYRTLNDKDVATFFGK
mgnify:FL=1